MSIRQTGTTQFHQEQYQIKLGARNFAISTKMILIAILFLSITLRLLSAVYQGNNVSDLPGVYDQISYDGLARRVVDGFGFSFAEGHWPATPAGEPTAHWSYLYTLYLALIYKLFEPYPLIARVIQALIAGIFQTLLIVRIGSRLFNRTVGLIAAALNAAYIYFFYYAGALMTETFYITCILWTFDVSFRLVYMDRNTHKVGQTRSRLQWLELGLAIGLTVLLRQLLLLFLPFLFIWIWWNLPQNEAVSWKRKIHLSAIRGLTISTAVLALLILPFTIRNYRAFGTFVLLNTNAGFAFFWGNHPVHGTHFMPLLSGGAQQYHDLIPTELLSLNEAELDKALLKLGIQFVADDPGRFLLLSISRMKEYFKFWPTAGSGLVSNLSRIGSFGISLPFVLYGLWVTLFHEWKFKKSNERWELVLILSFILVYTAIHLLSWTLIRYRLPLDSLFLIFAAVGIQRLAERYIPSFRVSEGYHV